MLHNLGSVAFLKNEYEKARNLLEESLTLQLEIGDKWGASESFMDLGKVLNILGEYNLAKIYVEESISLKEELEDDREKENLKELLTTIVSNQTNLASI